MRLGFSWFAAAIAMISPEIARAEPAPSPAPPPSAPVPAQPHLPVLNAEPAPAPQPSAPPPETPPGYYVEQPGSEPRRAGGGPQATYEPPVPPAASAFEPPPPPVPRHVAPRTALWLSARLGWFFPFGSAYAAGVPDPSGVIYLTGVPWTNYMTSGPAFEFDAGVRLARNYNLFALWERAEFRSGEVTRHYYGGQNGGDSDYFAGGIRASSDADGFGLITELSLGYRQARARWEDGSELRMTGGVLEGRIGVGADFRLSPLFSLQPIIAVGVGSFDRVQRVFANGASYDLIGPNDLATSHGWFSLSVAGSVDLFGSKD